MSSPYVGIDVGICTEHQGKQNPARKAKNAISLAGRSGSPIRTALWRGYIKCNSTARLTAARRSVTFNLLYMRFVCVRTVLKAITS